PTTSPAGAPLVLDPVADAVARARRHVRRALREADAAESSTSAELAVSELVTNAVLHARTPLTVAVRAAPAGRVRVEVADASPVPLRVRRLGAAATTGRGLRVVEALSSEWGVDPLPAGRGKTVWFVPRPGADGPGLDAGAWAAELEGLEGLS
ncbi:ATP-binding protein, partial [Kineococcus indalonis]|uniref:ATP-binding protein n=1 Tax=Kineococcus indalonis TaxID=2696566 RepID=UPI001412573A